MAEVALTFAQIVENGADAAKRALRFESRTALRPPTGTVRSRHVSLDSLH